MKNQVGNFKSCSHAVTVQKAFLFFSTFLSSTCTNLRARRLYLGRRVFMLKMCTVLKPSLPQHTLCALHGVMKLLISTWQQMITQITLHTWSFASFHHFIISLPIVDVFLQVPGTLSLVVITNLCYHSTWSSSHGQETYCTSQCTEFKNTFLALLIVQKSLKIWTLKSPTQKTDMRTLHLLVFYISQHFYSNLMGFLVALLMIFDHLVLDCCTAVEPCNQWSSSTFQTFILSHFTTPPLRW